VMQFANPRWHELGRLQSLGWRRLTSEAPVGSALLTLREVAQLEARAVLAGVGVGPRVTRYQREGGLQTLELRTERVGMSQESLFLIMAHDITEQVRAEDELKRTQEALIEREHMRALGELVSGIAHDLGSTLHALKIRLELLREDPDCATRQHAPLEALMHIVADANTRIHRLQSFAQQQAEHPGEQAQLDDIIHDAVEIIRSDIDHRGGRRAQPLRIDVSIPPLPPVSGSAADLRYVFLNLLLNARDAMPQGGTVRVRGRRQGKQVIVIVEDEGTGIPDAHLGSIFRPFFTTKGALGTGLGLSMAFDVMSRAGGTITAANRPTGGAIFTLTFLAQPLARHSRRTRKKALTKGEGNAASKA
jgi:signal transduction histidine kinase